MDHATFRVPEGPSLSTENTFFHEHFGHLHEDIPEDRWPVLTLQSNTCRVGMCAVCLCLLQPQVIVRVQSLSTEHNILHTADISAQCSTATL